MGQFEGEKLQRQEEITDLESNLNQLRECCTDAMGKSAELTREIVKVRARRKKLRQAYKEKGVKCRNKSLACTDEEITLKIKRRRINLHLRYFRKERNVSVLKLRADKTELKIIEAELKYLRKLLSEQKFPNIDDMGLADVA